MCPRWSFTTTIVGSLASNKPVIHADDHRPAGTLGPDDPGGADPLVLPAAAINSGGPGLDDTTLRLAPDAWWKLDEASGTTAHDSSGNGNDLTVPSPGWATPTWAQTAGPPGTQTAEFQTVVPGPPPPATRLYRSSFPALSGDFTAAVWANFSDNLGNVFMGQGQSSQSGAPGWEMGIEGVSVGGVAEHMYTTIGHSTGPHGIVGNNALTVNGTAWYLLGITRISGLWTMYVNGLAQAATLSPSYTAASGIWLGHNDNSANVFGTNGLLSYGMVWGSRGLSGAEMLELYTLAFTLGHHDSGEVLTADGSGGTTFAFPTFATYHNGVAV